MPLPAAPTVAPNNKTTRHQANNELLLKGLLCAFIGGAVLGLPYFITSPEWRSILAQSQWIGWFGVVLGLAFIVLHLRRRLAATRQN